VHVAYAIDIVYVACYNKATFIEDILVCNE
jgi:hypothetical protein